MFGPDAQNEDAQTGRGMGMLGVAGGLRIQKDKTKNNLLKKGLKKPNVPMFGGGGLTPAPNSFAASNNTNAGLVSTVAMTHTQGIELINPDLLKQKVANA